MVGANRCDGVDSSPGGSIDRFKPPHSFFPIHRDLVETHKILPGMCNWSRRCSHRHRQPHPPLFISGLIQADASGLCRPSKTVGHPNAESKKLVLFWPLLTIISSMTKYTYGHDVRLDRASPITCYSINCQSKGEEND